MSDYSQVTDFSAKDALAFGDSSKTVVGAELDTEWDAISAALATKLEYAGGVFSPVWVGFVSAVPSNGAVDFRWQIFRDGSHDLVILTTVDGAAVTGNAGTGTSLSISNLPKRIWPTGAQNSTRYSSKCVAIIDGNKRQCYCTIQADGQLIFNGIASNGTLDSTPATASTSTRGVPAGWMTMYALTVEA